MDSFSELIYKVQDWGDEHDLHNPTRQLNKVIEEVGELAHEITRDKYKNNPDLADAFGDVLVTIIILAHMLGYDLYDCLDAAYKEISQRKGETKNGTFIKEEK